VQNLLSGTLAIFFTFLAGASGQTNTVKTSSERPAVPVEQMSIRPVAPEVTQHAQTLRAALQPSAKAWVDQQAQAEAKRPSANADALRAAVRQRFASSLSQAKAGQPGVAASQMDVDAVVILVMEQAAQDQTQDLQAQLQQMQQVNKEKQELRQLQEEMQQAQAQMEAQLQANAKNTPCKTPFCQSLPARLAELNRAGATLPRPVHLQTPGNMTTNMTTTMTVEQLGQAAAQVTQALASVSDMSQQMQTVLQTAMDQRSKALDALSNMAKSMSASAAAVVQNLK